MDWEPNERDAWVVDAQRWISNITGVLQCKIDLDENGEVTGIHVIAGMDREPRHIVRDVESLLKARLDMDVYYKKIGVVQVLDNGEMGGTDTFSVSGGPEPSADADAHAQHVDAVVEEALQPTSSLPPSVQAITPEESETAETPARETESPAPRWSARGESEPVQAAVLLTEEIPPRLVCNGVGTMASDQTVRAEVTLQAGELEARGICDGPNSLGSELTLVARACLQAIGQLLEEPVILHLNEVRQETAGGRQVILTAIDLVEGRRNETFFGTCACEHNRQQAVVYSVLDALNRRLSLMAFKTAGLRSAEATA